MEHSFKVQFDRQLLDVYSLGLQAEVEASYEKSRGFEQTCKFSQFPRRLTRERSSSRLLESSPNRSNACWERTGWYAKPS